MRLKTMNFQHIVKPKLIDVRTYTRLLRVLVRRRLVAKSFSTFSSSIKLKFICLILTAFCLRRSSDVNIGTRVEMGDGWGEKEVHVFPLLALYCFDFIFRVL